MKLNRRHDQSVVIYDDHGEGAGEYRGDPIIMKQILIDLLSAAISGAGRQGDHQDTGPGSRQREGAHKVEFTLSSNNPVQSSSEKDVSHGPLAGRLIRDCGGNWQESTTGAGSYFVFYILCGKLKSEPACSSQHTGQGDGAEKGQEGDERP
jgi:hypothetical protein